MSGERSYFVVCGPGRVGTAYLNHAFNLQPGVQCWHDAWWPHREAQDIRRFDTAAGPHIGCVGSPALFAIKLLEERYHPRWAFLWRDPLWVVASYANIHLQIAAAEGRHDELKIPHGPFLRRIAMELFGKLETALRLFDRLGIEVAHFHMRAYTTPRGFADLCRHLGFEATVPPDGPRHGMPRRVGTPPQWDAFTRAAVLNLFNSLPLLSETHARVCDEYERTYGKDANAPA